MKNLNFLFISCLLFTITSCTTTLYIPNGSNVPLLRENKELKVTVSSGNNLQAAYAVTDHVGLMANGFWTLSTGDDNEIPGNRKGKGSLVELGAGYFSRFSNMVLETYVGGGIGKLDYNDTENGKSYSSGGSRVFIQPNLGWTSKYIDVAVSGRLSGVKYNNFLAEGYTPAELDQEFLRKANVEDKLWVFFEPAITLRGGYKYVKAQFQYGLSSKLTTGDLKFADTYSSIGLVFDIGNWYHN